MSGVTLSIISL